MTDSTFMKHQSVALLFAISLLCGLWITDRSWNGQIFVYIGEQRSPAAVRSILDFTSFDRKALYRSANRQLRESAQVVHRDGFVGVQLGQPLITQKSGGKAFGCEMQDLSGVFDQIELTFIGTGISEAGEPARMIVEAPCRSTHDVKLLEPVWIPMQAIFASEPKDQEMQTYEQNPVVVRLEAIPNQWPESWVLWSVRLYRKDNPDETLKIDARLLKEANPNLLSFDWTHESR